MPEMISYIVTETREVEVTANSAADATRIADAAFKHGQLGTGVAKDQAPDGIWGNTTTRIRQLELHTKEKRYGK